MPHGEFDAATSTVKLTTQWSDKTLVQQVAGARWDGNDKTWHVPATWPAVVQLRGVFGDAFTLGQSLIDEVWHWRNTWVDDALRLRQQVEPDPHWTFEQDPGQHLYPYQEAGVQFALTAGSGIIADEMGTGKTITLTGFVSAQYDPSVLPALVICPNSVKYHWANALETFAPHTHPFVLDGSLPKKRKTLKEARQSSNAVVIVNIESVRLFTRLAPYGSVRLKRCRECDPKFGDEGLSTSRCDVHRKELNDFNFKVVVLDEAHRVKDPKAQQTRAIWHVMHQDSVKYRWALTGTPIANHPGDLWSILHAVAPTEYPSKRVWLERYALMAWNSFGGMDIVGIRPDTRDEFFRQLDPRFRRILKAVVLPQLPPKVRSTRYVEMTTAQARMYRELESTLTTRTPDGQLLVAPTQLAAHTRLMQLSSSSVKITKVDPDDITTWEVTLVDPSPKLDALEEILDELGVLAHGFDGPPVLVAAEHKQLINLAAKRLDKLGVRYALVTGDVSPYDRQKALDALRARAIRVLMFTNKAGGVGMDMSASDTLINLQRSWSLVDERQKEDRNHRIGSEIHECVRIIDVVTRDTVEESQIKTLLEKLERLEEITRDRAAILAANPHALTDELDALEAEVMSRGLTNFPPLDEVS